MDLGKLKILLVEDNPGDARLVKEMLREIPSARIEVDHVNCADEAMRRTGQAYYHAVLLDLTLPDATGLTTISRIQAAAPNLAVVVLSGQGDESVALEAVQAGAQDYLVKGHVDGHLLSRSLRYSIERKRTEEALKRANDELKELSRLKSGLVSSVSHEMRTPLTSIKNALDLLNSEKTGPMNANQQRFIVMAMRNSRRLTRIINDLLDLNRLEEGRFRLQFTLLSLNDLVRQIIATFRPQAEQQSLKLEVEAPRRVPPVYADPARVEQVLGNLINNALKFTPRGGRILVSIRPEGEMVEVGVKDSGIGLSPPEQSRVFERFYQAESSRTRTAKGAGLGLYLAKQLVEAQGGSIGVKCDIGAGCHFFFTLPVYSNRILEVVALESELRQFLNYPSFSFLLTEISKFGSDPGLSDEQVAGIVERIADLFRKQLYRDSDAVICQPALSRVVTVLANTPRTGALVVKEKFEKLLCQNLGSFDPTLTLTPKFQGPTSYPEDGLNAQQLIAHARRSN